MKNYILSLVISSFLLIPLGSQAQLLEVKQTVFGMDCAPCAYGLEKRIQKMDGIQSVSVSLNDGLLTADLKPNNTLTLQAIRQAVEESGFKAKDATISASGTISRGESGNYMLETSAGEHFTLKTEDQSTLDRLSEAGGVISVFGKAENSEKDKTVLWVQSVDKSKS